MTYFGLTVVSIIDMDRIKLKWMLKKQGVKMWTGPMVAFVNMMMKLQFP